MLQAVILFPKARNELCSYFKLFPIISPMLDSRDIVLWLVTSVLHPFFYTEIIFTILRIASSLPSESVRFIRIVRGSPRDVFNCLNNLFGLLMWPVFLLFLRVFTALPLCFLSLK